MVVVIFVLLFVMVFVIENASFASFVLVNVLLKVLSLQVVIAFECVYCARVLSALESAFVSVCVSISAIVSCS